jgi:phosphatidylinositol 3,5-bisphosphate 5-phosphatase
MGLNSHLEASDDEDEPIFQSVRNKESSPPTQTKPQESSQRPSLDPYIGKLERFELFSTNQCYYLVACDKHNMSYRVMKMDRTLIERPLDEVEGLNHQRSAPPEQTGSQNSEFNAAALEAAHTAKPTLRPLSDFLAEDPHTYSQGEIQDMLDMIHHGNRYTRSDGNGDDREGGGGLKPLCKGYGILGFIRFLDCYYLTLITRRAKVGSIGGNGIYTVKNTDTFPLKPAERIHSGGRDGDLHTDPSSMLLNMWNRGKRSVGLGLTNREIAELRYQGLYQVVDFTKNFYFSYTYDLTRSLQENFLATTSQPFPPPPFKDMYAWNFFLTRELEESTNSLTSYYWVMPVIHGAFIQRKLNDYGRILNMCLVARRSRHFAGTRYLKRGVSEQGKCANDVEHEQVLHDESGSVVGGVFSSYLQVRGSIPTYWTQESSVTMPKPPIELNRVDPTYRATQVHFEDLFKRYGSPIIVLDLVKQSEKREREVRVGNEFRHAIDYMNTSIDEAHQIRYCALDYSHISKHRNLDVSTSLNEVSTWSVNQTGFFCSTPQWKIVDGGNIVPFNDKDKEAASFLTQQLGVPVFPMEQCGVLRTNCIE